MDEYVLGIQIRKLLANGEVKLAYLLVKGVLKGTSLQRKQSKLERAIELHNANSDALESVIDKTLSE